MNEAEPDKRVAVSKTETLPPRFVPCGGVLAFVDTITYANNLII